MEKDNLSKSIFIILLLSLFFILIYAGISKIKYYDIFAGEEKVYVNIDKIYFPENKELQSNNINESDFDLESYNTPKLLSEFNYTYKPKTISVDILNDNSKESFIELENNLNEDLVQSMDASYRKNVFVVNLLNGDKIKTFEKDSRELLNSKILESCRYKHKTYLQSITSNEHVELMNTEKNRYDASKNFSQYMANRNAYLNFYYLYNINLERFKQQESLKTENQVKEDFEKYKKEQIKLIDDNISSLNKLTHNVISKIETGDKVEKFTFKPVENIDINKISDFKFENNRVSKTSFLKIKEKEKIIRQIASDHNLKVTFYKTNKTQDYTDKMQSYINEFLYLYIM